MDTTKFLKHISLTSQFERRQKAWRPNMDIVQDELYLVDGVLMGEYVPPSATNEHEMTCFDPQAWQAVVHNNGAGGITP